MKSENCILNELGYERFETVIDMVASKCKLRIVFFLAFHEVLRYGELKKLLHPITHKMLTSQLKELERDGLVIRKEYPQVPPKLNTLLAKWGKIYAPLSQVYVIGLHHIKFEITKGKQAF